MKRSFENYLLLQPTTMLVVGLVARPGGSLRALQNIPLETRAKGHFPTGELNAKMRSKKVHDFGVFSSVGNFFGSYFGVRFHWRIVFFGSGCHCEVFFGSPGVQCHAFMS